MCDHADREAAMVILATDETGRPTVWCDPCIAPLVAALNAAGLETVASCCGHGRRPGSVALADGREVILATHDEARAVDHFWPDINAPLESRQSSGHAAATVKTRVFFHETPQIHLGQLLRGLGSDDVDPDDEIVDGMTFIKTYTPYGWLRIPEDDLGGPVADGTQLSVTIEVADG